LTLRGRLSTIAIKGNFLFSIKPIFRLIATAVLVVLTGCTPEQPSQADLAKRGFYEVPGRFMAASHDELKLSHATLLTFNHPDLETSKGGRAEVKYDDGADLLLWAPPELENETGRQNLQTLKFVNRNTVWTPIVKYQDPYYGVGPLDGRDWMDSEIWILVDINATKNAIKYQACREDRFYSAPDSKTLMDVVDRVERDPAAAKSDPEVKKYLLTDDALVRRLPVCNWRHRIGLEGAYPPPPNPAVRVMPASHTRLGYAEAKGDKGAVVDVYIDEDKQRLDRVLFKSPKGSFSWRPVYADSDCPTIDRCEHVTAGPGKQPDRFEVRSLDDEPLSQSRIFAVDDTVSGIRYYDGCAGGRLYSGKNRQTVEGEIKVALENPAPPPVKGAPPLGAPETSESGDIVIPDTFCDWTSRRQQAQELMKKKSQAAQ
jgi:hypothetical protein